MFVTVEGGNHWCAEEKFIEAFWTELDAPFQGAKVGDSRSQCRITGPEEFLRHIQTPMVGEGNLGVDVKYLFLKGVFSLLEGRSMRTKDSTEAQSWLMERRKVENEHIILSDIFDKTYLEARIRRLVTHKIGVADSPDGVIYRLFNILTGRLIKGKLGEILPEPLVLEALESSAKPMTKDESELQAFMSRPRV